MSITVDDWGSAVVGLKAEGAEGAEGAEAGSRTEEHEGSPLTLELVEENSSTMGVDGLHVTFYKMEARTGQSDFFGIEFAVQPDAADPDTTLKVIRRIKRDSTAASFEPPNQMLAPGMVLRKVQGEDVLAEDLATTLGRIEMAPLPIELVFAAGIDGSMPHIVAVETPRDAYGFPFAVGRGTGSGYFNTSPRTHRRIDAEVQTKSVSRKARKRVETQEKKWQRWLEEPDCTDAIKIAKLGVPELMRRDVWPKLAGLEEMKAKCTDDATFVELSKAGENGAMPESPIRTEQAVQFDLDQIEKDLLRTFPSHRLFDSSNVASSGGVGVDVLRQMLTAFVHRNPTTGYVQSMNYVAATIIICLLQRVDDSGVKNEERETAFWLFSAIVENIMPQYYVSDLFGVQRDTLCMVLSLRRLLPQLYAHLDRLCMLDRVKVQFFTPWLMKLFVNALPVSTVLRVWDLMLAELFAEGEPTELLVRVGLAALAEHEHALLKVQDSEAFAEELHRACAQTTDVDALLSRVCSRRWVRIVSEEQESAVQDLRPPPPPEAEPEPEPEPEPELEPEPEPEPELGPDPELILHSGTAAEASAGTAGNLARTASQPLSRTRAAQTKKVLTAVPPAAGSACHYYIVVCKRANVREKKSKGSDSCGVLQEGTVVAARREVENMAGRLRIQFEYKGDDGASKLGWVSVISNAGRVLLRRCSSWEASPATRNNLLLDRTTSPMICSFWCCTRVEVFSSPALKETIAWLEAGVTIDGLERRPKQKVPRLNFSALLPANKALGSVPGSRVAARAHVVRFELPDMRMGWVCSHDQLTGQLQLLDTFMRAESFVQLEGHDVDEQPAQMEDGVPLPPSLQEQQHRCNMELAEIERLKKEYEIAMRADESPVIRSDLDEQLAAWKQAKMRVDGELIKQDPQVVKAKAQQTAASPDPAAIAEVLELPPLPLSSATSSGTDTSTPRQWPQRTLSFGDWVYNTPRPEEAEPPFDQWGRPRGHVDYNVDPSQLLIENSDGDSSEDDVSNESDNESEESEESEESDDQDEQDIVHRAE
eukprot:COSAG02_NODE_1726_length_11183_cov_93.592746_6_plen_1047_part_00